MSIDFGMNFWTVLVPFYGVKTIPRGAKAAPGGFQVDDILVQKFASPALLGEMAAQEAPKTPKNPPRTIQDRFWI